MSAEQLPGQSSLQQHCEPPKRRRTPSQYASHIAQLKSNYSFTDKKNKSCKQLENSEAPQPTLKQLPGRPLICVLPSGKKYTLKIELGSIKTSKIDRATKKKSKVLNQSPSPLVKGKQDKQKDENQTFFDKFLLVVEQLQKKDEHQSKEVNEASKQNFESRLSRRDEKIRREREREQKWSKSYERMRNLSEKLDRLVSNLTFLN